MSTRIQGIRGMHDILPEQTPVWQHIEDTARAVCEAYGYREIRLPLVERTELFRRSIGEVTDIVEKEMYTFEDQGGDSLTLRPEGTAGCVRAGIENGLLGNQVHRLWYAGPMFRRERPQKGRYRQFHQVGVEAFGLEGPDVDAELILMNARLWRRLGVGGLRLELNSLGTPQARARYREDLVAYLERRGEDLDADSRRRLHTNPLRILDSKNPAMTEVIAEAPALIDYLDEASRAHFEELRGLLDDAGVGYEINPRLVRGLDYYTRTVFEWVTDELGAQGTVCAGGRYDELVEQLGGKPTPATGFALGMERLVALLGLTARPEAEPPHAYLVMVGDTAVREGFFLAERLRDALPGLRLHVHCGGGSFKAQLRRADKSDAQVALILGEQEVADGTVAVKPLRDGAQQQVIEASRLHEWLSALMRGERAAAD